MPADLTPVNQTIISNVNGDCERACVATITGIPIAEIPNFSEPGLPVDQWMQEWLPTRGWGIIQAKRDTGPKDYTYSGLAGLVAIASVPSQAFPGSKHAVVVGWRDHPQYPGALECYVVHDPNPNNAPYEDVADQAERLRWVVPVAIRG